MEKDKKGENIKKQKIRQGIDEVQKIELDSSPLYLRSNSVQVHQFSWKIHLFNPFDEIRLKGNREESNSKKCKSKNKK